MKNLKKTMAILAVLALTALALGSCNAIADTSALTLTPETVWIRLVPSVAVGGKATLVLDFSKPLADLTNEPSVADLAALFTFANGEGMSGAEKITPTGITKDSDAVYRLSVDHVPDVEKGIVLVTITKQGIAPPTRAWSLDGELVPDEPAWEYTLSFDPHNGGTVPSITQAVGTQVQKPAPDPSLTGYTFTGWFDAAIDGIALTWPLTITADRTVHAQWQEHANFVALATNSATAAYSVDGITWTETDMPSSGDWYGVTYGSGKFVAVAYSGDKGAYSVDGINWTETTMPGGDWWVSVTHGNGVFVAIGGEGAKSARSTDGINWTAVGMPHSGVSSSVAYGNGIFVTQDYEAGSMVYSTDFGITWVNPWDGSWTGYNITFGGGRFVAVTANYATYSMNGIDWSPGTLSGGSMNGSISYGDGIFVVVWLNGQAHYSTDGIDWLPLTMPSNNWNGVSYGNGKFIAVGNGKAASSANGTSWQSIAAMPSGNWQCVAGKGNSG
jgi:uncharacterized repeat protein (TIGR02543 family)